LTWLYDADGQNDDGKAVDLGWRITITFAWMDYLIYSLRFLFASMTLPILLRYYISFVLAWKARTHSTQKAAQDISNVVHDQIHVRDQPDRIQISTQPQSLSSLPLSKQLSEALASPRTSLFALFPLLQHETTCLWLSRGLFLVSASSALGRPAGGSTSPTPIRSNQEQGGRAHSQHQGHDEKLEGD
jgi:hypothetical protein